MVVDDERVNAIVVEGDGRLGNAVCAGIKSVGSGPLVLHRFQRGGGEHQRGAFAHHGVP